MSMRTPRAADTTSENTREHGYTIFSCSEGGSNEDGDRAWQMYLLPIKTTLHLTTAAALASCLEYPIHLPI